MLESVRNFLSGKRVIVIAVVLAIPFVFLGSTSFGTTFSSYGTVNGEPVTQIDINLATSQVSQRLQSIYGEEFSLEDLDEETSLGLIKNEIINQKTLLAQVKRMGLTTSEKKAKQEIINLDNFSYPFSLFPRIDAINTYISSKSRYFYFFIYFFLKIIDALYV